MHKCKKNLEEKLTGVEKNVDRLHKIRYPVNIQIIIFNIYTLHQFYKKVKDQLEDILDIIEYGKLFGDICPLCGAHDCARFIGFYYRGVIDEKGRFYKYFPVPRFLCQGKGTAVVNHKTFSLLHYQLIPYHKYSIPFMIQVLKSRHMESRTLEALQKYIFDFTATGPVGTNINYIELTFSRIFAFQSLVKDAINKILFNQYYKEVTAHWQSQKVVGNNNELIKVFLQFCTQFERHINNNPIRGPCALSYDFYLKGGTHVHNNHFLFGTPSQFRI